MRPQFVIPGVVCLSMMCAASARADEQQDAAAMEQLVADVKKVVPSGWIVDFQLVDPEVPSRRGSHPALVIKSSAPLPVEYMAPNPPFIAGDDRDAEAPEISQVVVDIHFVAVPYMSPQDHAAARQKNNVLTQRRIDFAQQLVRKSILRAHMGPDPIPPYAFEPRTENDRRLVRQYAFLWVSTQPQPLPTHYAGHLAFTMYDAGAMKIHDDAKAKEYAQILEAVKRILTAYKNEA